MRKIVVSVPHSGTRFIRKRLGVEDYIHTSASWEKLWQEVKGREIVVPLRSPSTVWRSWCRRESGRDVLQWSPGFFVAWTVLHALDRLFELDVICIDTQQDPRIADWTAEGDKDASGTGWKLHKVDLRPLYKLPIVAEHFGAWQ